MQYNTAGQPKSRPARDYAPKKRKNKNLANLPLLLIFIALLALITRQLRMLTHLAFARESGASLDAVEKEMKIHPYAARKMRGQIRRLSARALEEAYLSCVEADFAVKSGKLRDAAALERILLKISDFGRN